MLKKNRYYRLNVHSSSRGGLKKHFEILRELSIKLNLKELVWV